MKYTKFVKTGSKMMTLGFVIFFLQNIYFGWNKEPLSKLEEYIDIINKIVLYLGLAIYLIPVFTLYEEFVEKLDKQFFVLYSVTSSNFIS